MAQQARLWHQRAVASAMILAAGYGTRLRPLTDELPKPLMPVGDAPAIAHVARALSGVANSLVVNTHHRADAFDGLVLPLPHVALHETEILGTAGGVARARAAFDGAEVVVWNGDIVADVDARALVDRLRATGALAAWVVAPRPCGQGTVGLSRDGFVVRVRSVVVGEEASGGQGQRQLEHDQLRLKALQQLHGRVDVGCDSDLTALRLEQHGHQLGRGSVLVDDQDGGAGERAWAGLHAHHAVRIRGQPNPQTREAFAMVAAP